MLNFGGAHISTGCEIDGSHRNPRLSSFLGSREHGTSSQVLRAEGATLKGGSGGGGSGSG